MLPASLRFGSGGLLLGSMGSAADEGAEGRSGSRLGVGRLCRLTVELFNWLPLPARALPSRAVARGLMVPFSTVKQVDSGFTIPDEGVGLQR